MLTLLNDEDELYFYLQVPSYVIMHSIYRTADPCEMSRVRNHQESKTAWERVL